MAGSDADGVRGERLEILRLVERAEECAECQADEPPPAGALREVEAQQARVEVAVPAWMMSAEWPGIL